jgi:hypothetical protein
MFVKPRAPKTTFGFVLNLMCLCAALTLTIGFNLWRRDMPPNNPGGPIGPMGEPYVTWNWFALSPGPMLCAWLSCNTILYLAHRFQMRFGGPTAEDGLPFTESRSTTTRWTVALLPLFGLALYGIIACTSYSPKDSFGYAVAQVVCILLALLIIVYLVPQVRQHTFHWMRWARRRFAEG